MPSCVYKTLFVCFLIGVGRSQRTQSFLEKTTADISYIKILTPNMFFNKSSVSQVRYTASLQGQPDPPSWLSLSQSEHEHNAVLHGTPKGPQHSALLQVVAVDLQNHDTSVQTYRINIKGRDVKHYQFELTLLNYDVSELLTSDLLPVLLRKIKRLWREGASDLQIVNVQSLAEQEGRKPRPISPDVDSKEGVVLTLGSTADFSKQLKDAKFDIHHADCSGKKGRLIISVDAMFQPDFTIDWCRLKLVSLPMSPADTSGQQVKPVPLIDTWWRRQTPVIVRRDFLMDFIITVVFPLGLGLLLFFILSYVMFGRREGVGSRDSLTPDTQMEQFNTIRRATANLRSMSNQRDCLPGSGQQGTSAANDTPVSTHSLDDPLPCAKPPGQAPPPYRLPPTYNADTNRSHRLQPSMYQDESQEEEHLSSQAHPTLPIRY